MSFTKRRILQLWQVEKKKLSYLLPQAKDNIEFLTLGYQMIGRMKPILEQGYNEDLPNEKPYIIDVIEWMEKIADEDGNETWTEMAREFLYLLDQSKEYNKAHQL